MGPKLYPVCKLCKWFHEWVYL